MKYKLLLLLLLMCSPLLAQLSFTGQLRTRTEYRDGVGTLRLKSIDPAFFTSQRTRLTAAYKNSRVQFQATLQDVRVWGQDASTISANDGSKLGVHEAWAEVTLLNKSDSTLPKGLDYLALKIGRQELLYDDSRLLGNLDWLQQARRHDAILLKMLHHGWRADLGLAFNQNTDAFQYDGTYYTPANVIPYIKDSKGNLVVSPTGMIPTVNAQGISSKSGSLAVLNPPSTNALGQNYKSLQFLYVSKSFSSSKLTGLLLSDQFGAYTLDSTRNVAGRDTGYVFGRKYHSSLNHARFTYGLTLSSMLEKSKKVQLNAGFFYQSGHDKDGLLLDAFTSTLAVSMQHKLWSYTLGWDYVSGNDAFSSSPVNHRFDPLYGTPHKFWGYMDYFYVATGAPLGGLSNVYAKAKYLSKNKRFSTGFDLHYFALANQQKRLDGQLLDAYLGMELDWISTYMLNKSSQIEVGLCTLNASDSMEYAKSIIPGTSQKNAQWAYLQLNILL